LEKPDATMTLIRKLRLILIAVILLNCAFAQDRNEQFVQIVSAIENKEFEKALELLEPLLKASPESAELLAMRGFALAGEGHKKEALASFLQGLQKSPANTPALTGAIQIEFDDGNLAAIPLLQRKLRLSPDDATSHAMLAVLEYKQGNCAAAVPHFEKSGTILDSQLDGLHANATCLVKLKQPDKAAAIFQRALALNPDDPKERRLVAAVQLMAHNSQAALATLAPLLQGNAPEVETLELASAAYESGKDTSRAVSTLQQAISLDPQDVNLYLDFTNICYEHGSFQVGIDVVNDGLEIQPNAAPLYFARGVLFVQLAQYEKAEADFERSYQLDPSQSLSAAALGLAAAQQNDFDRALEKVQASLVRKPNDPLMLYLQADILAARNADHGSPEFQLAVRSARKAIALQPTLGAAHGVLAKLYLKAGRYPEAIDQCRKALQTDPGDQATVYHLIQALRKTSNQSEIPALLKRLALLREQSLRKDKERYRYKLVD
jgi:tetratricopeptide (TPR) repeat protein